MFKKFLVILLLSIGYTNLFGIPPQITECKVILDTSNIEYFDCGFTEDSNPENNYPLLNQDIVQSRAIGGIVPAENIEITSRQTSNGLDIRSEVYTIWAFKIGLKNVIIHLEGSPLKFDKYTIPYEIYVDKTDPLLINKPTLTVSNVQGGVDLSVKEMAEFIKFWKTKFIIRVPKIPPTAGTGTYSGNLILTITSI